MSAKSFHTDPMLRDIKFSFPPKDLDVAIDALNPGTGFNSVHTHLPHQKFKSLLPQFII